jgi:zinc transport system substrate-binding protein
VNILSSFLNKVRKEFVIAVLVLFGLMTTNVFAINVTVSIPPLAGMIAPILGADDRIDILLKPGASPHGFQLKPSNLRTLQQADFVVWLDTPVDQWLTKSVHNLKSNQLAMNSLPGLKTLPVREGGLWDKSAHHHENEDHENEEHEHEIHANQPDGHLWMSYENSVELIKAFSRILQKNYPERASEFQSNTHAWLIKLQLADEKVKQKLSTVKNEPYMVLHDAFQYFEHRYQLNGVGSIQLNPSVAPSLKRVQSLRQKIKNSEIRCVFKEPQFPEKRVLAITKGLSVKLGSLDPLGTISVQSHKTGYLPYDLFIEELGNQFYHCLGVQ